MKFLSTLIVVFVGLLFWREAIAQEVPPTPVVQDTTYDVTFQAAGAVLQQLDVNGGILLSSGDDVNDIVSIGFDFVFFGNTFNTVNVSSNGFISFSDFGNGCCGSELQFGSPNTIYALWMDLVANNSTYYKTYKVQGQDVFTAGWYNAYELGSPSTFHNFEITLFSGTNDFKITYGNNMAPASPYSAGYVGPMGEIYAIQPYGVDQSIISNTTYTFTLAPPPPPEPPIAVDCNIAPSDPSCIINSIIDNIVTEDPMLADMTTVTPEESVEMFTSPTVTEEATAAVVEEQSVEELEELLAGGPDASDNVIETQEEASLEETEDATESDTKEELVASTNEAAASGSIDPALLSLVLSIVDSTSAIGASATPGSPTSAVSSTNNTQSSSTQSLANSNQQDLLSQTYKEESLISFDGRIDDPGRSSFDREIKEINEILSPVTDLNNPVATAAAVTNNFANQEAAGLLSFNEEYKVSMNDDSSENFMGEDQSSTIDDMVAGVDFSSYTSAMLFDASAWYKPEDIYKNNTISDNARSLYFMQKGSSDTFNQMVQEQYK